VIDIVRELHDLHVIVDIYDPWAKAQDAEREYGLALIDEPEQGIYDAVIIAVAHDQFRRMSPADIRGFCRRISVVYDVKGLLPIAASDGRL
jgi:UDP-N-acetyl-D-galactosamine dehydrogenase